GWELGIQSQEAQNAETYEATRSSEHTKQLATLEWQLAKSEKQLAIDTAAAERDYQLALLSQAQEEDYAFGWGFWGYLPWDSDAWQERQEDLGGCDLARVISREDAQLTFHKDEAEDRRKYSEQTAAL